MKWVFKSPLVMIGAILLVSPALASPTEVGVAVVVIHGKHSESTAVASAPAVPVPFFSATHRMGRFEIAAEGIPPLGKVPVRGNGLGLNGIALTYVSGALRYHMAQTSIGIGETIYNQETTYLYGAPVTPDNASISETDRSRVVGLQYEIVQTLRRTLRSELEARFGYNPHMTASLGQQSTYNFAGGISRGTRWTATPESGSQIDAMLSNRVKTRKFTVQYGMRYLNLLMRFPDGSLADRNAFFVPFVGFWTTLGR